MHQCVASTVCIVKQKLTHEKGMKTIANHTYKFTPICTSYWTTKYPVLIIVTENCTVFGTEHFIMTVYSRTHTFHCLCILNIMRRFQCTLCAQIPAKRKQHNAYSLHLMAHLHLWNAHLTNYKTKFSNFISFKNRGHFIPVNEKQKVLW
jgi:hypothetical protein